MPFFKPLKELCDPAKLYLVISVISIIASLMTSNILGIAIHAVSVILWAFLLGWLCDQGYPGVSWFLVLALPVLMITILIIGAVFLLSRPRSERSEILKGITSHEEELEGEDKEGEDKEGMEGFNKKSLEKMSINNPQQLGNAIQGMMSMDGDAFSNPSDVNEAFGPML
jgi:hypothetical protein